jgi:hypothetical protein
MESSLPRRILEAPSDYYLIHNYSPFMIMSHLFSILHKTSLEREPLNGLKIDINREFFSSKNKNCLILSTYSSSHPLKTKSYFWKRNVQFGIADYQILSRHFSFYLLSFVVDVQLLNGLNELSIFFSVLILLIFVMKPDISQLLIRE